MHEKRDELRTCHCLRRGKLIRILRCLSVKQGILVIVHAVGAERTYRAKRGRRDCLYVLATRRVASKHCVSIPNSLDSIVTMPYL